MCSDHTFEDWSYAGNFKGKAMDHEGNRVKTSLSRQVLVSYKLLGVLMAF